MDNIKNEKNLASDIKTGAFAPVVLPSLNH
jgi:hypothetical protein